MAHYPTSRIVTAAGWVLIIGAALKALYSITRIVTTSAPDFAYYYEAAVIAATYGADSIHLLPPPSVPVFLPLKLLPYGIAQALWVVGSALCLIVVVVQVIRRLGVRGVFPTALATALSYLSFPVQFTLGMGQVNLLSLLLLVWSAHAANIRPALSGIAYAAAVLYKPELILLLPVVAAGRLRVGLWATAGLTVAALGALVLYGANAYAEYTVRMQSLTGGWNDIGVYYNQGLSGMLARMGASRELYVVLSAALIVLTVVRHWRLRLVFGERLWRVMPLFILVEPIAWQHHLALLIPTYLTLWVKRRTVWEGVILAVSYLLVSWNFESAQFLGTMPMGWLVSSHATVGVVLLWVVTLL